MTPKRFKCIDLIILDGFIMDTVENEHIDDENEIVELLNELHEENTMLKERRHEDINDLSVIAMRYKALEKENEQLKKALWCIRKRYGYTVEEFIEDLKDNGIDLTKVDLE